MCVAKSLVGVKLRFSMKGLMGRGLAAVMNFCHFSVAVRDDKACDTVVNS